MPISSFQKSSCRLRYIRKVLRFLGRIPDALAGFQSDRPKDVRGRNMCNDAMPGHGRRQSAKGMSAEIGKVEAPLTAPVTMTSFTPSHSMTFLIQS